MNRLAITLLFLVAGCSAEIEVADGGSATGATGATSSGTGGAASHCACVSSDLCSVASAPSCGVGLVCCPVEGPAPASSPATGTTGGGQSSGTGTTSGGGGSTGSDTATLGDAGTTWTGAAQLTGDPANDGFGVGYVGSAFDGAQGKADRSRLYIVLFDGDQSSAWSLVCPSLWATIPGTGTYLELEVNVGEGGTVDAGAYSIGTFGDVGGYVSANTGTAADPNQAGAQSGQITLTEVGEDGSASGLFALTFNSGFTLSGSFSSAVPCPTLQ